MTKPTLIIMAAGMGSRFGGLKQIETIDEAGHIIMDFSIYDAKRAGFEKVVFIIKEEHNQLFREAIGNRIERFMEVSYVYQGLGHIPAGLTVPEGRTKPYGTGHAVLCCKDVVKEPFAVINADDFYGFQAFSKLYKFLSNNRDDVKYRYCMVGYKLENTLSKSGFVSRGICEMDEENYLTGIVERVRVERQEGAVAFTEDDGASWTTIPEGSIVSMNMFGCTQSMFRELETRFYTFLTQGIKADPLKKELFLPTVVNELIAEEKATVEVLTSTDSWYGITYQEDKKEVEVAIRKMKDEGIYPKILWE